LCLAEGLTDPCTRPWIRRAWVQQEVMASKSVYIRCGEYTLAFKLYQKAPGVLDALAGGLWPSSSRAGSTVASCQTLQDMRTYTSHMLSLLEYRRLRPDEKHICECFQNWDLRHSQESGRSRAANNLRFKSNPECVLSSSTSLMASNPRDRVYALLGTTNCLTGKTRQQANQQGQGRGHGRRQEATECAL